MILLPHNVHMYKLSFCLYRLTLSLSGCVHPLPQDLSLMFYYRIFTLRSSQTSRIVYLSLVDGLVHYFMSQSSGEAVTLSMMIDPADDSSAMLLARVSTEGMEKENYQ